jgi:hypothetical protein
LARASKEARRLYDIKWREKNRELLKRRHREIYNPRYKKRREDARVRREFGVSRDEYDARKKAAGRCAICPTGGAEHLDHNHATGALRDFLCIRCNMGLGQFADDPVLLRAAADYLEEWQRAHRRKSA